MFQLLLQPYLSETCSDTYQCVSVKCFIKQDNQSESYTDPKTGCKYFITKLT